MADDADPKSLATDTASEAESVPKFPKAVFFILGQELCERFSYYGMRSVLMLYMKRELCLRQDQSKIIYHLFSMLNYFIPLLGGLIADIWLGKFRTILYISLVYAFGNILLSLTSVPQLMIKPKVPFLIASLITIAIGSGGIKPCVASFGGDQFVKSQESMRDKFFSIFYFCINVGAALSMILSPIFRADVSCLGEVECYPLAFGFPAFLMVIATTVFIIGKPLYKIFPPRGTAVVDTARCIFHALRSRRKATEKKAHWLDYADDKYDPSYIQDVRTVLSVLLLLLPLPMFWALFDQQGSTWTLQSAQLSGLVTEKIEIHPDQMDSMNAILVLVFIPIFTFLLYPLLAKCRLLRTPLQKMSTGGFLAGISFLVGGFIQLAIEARLPEPPAVGTNDIMLINTVNCPIDVKFASEKISLSAHDFYIFNGVRYSSELKGSLILSKSCIKLLSEQNETDKSVDFILEVKPQKVYSVAISITSDGFVVGPPSEQIRKRDPSKANPYARIIYMGEKPFPNASLLAIQEGVTVVAHCNEPDATEQYQELVFEKNSTFTSYGSFYSKFDCEICWAIKDSSTCQNTPKIPQKISMYKGGIFEYLLVPVNQNEMKLIEMMSFNPDSISILIQTPMYIIITAGEVMLSISGLTFAYSEAPAGMKAVLQAAWLLTVAFGNVIVVIIVQIRKSYFEHAKDSTFFFVFAVLMGVDMLIFSLLAFRYKYKAKE